MTQDRAFDAGAVRAWGTLASEALAGARDRIDAANVFPVADSDTGTNLWLTISAGAAAIDPAEQDAAGALEDFAQGALLAARGNSGIIASELLRGMSVSLLSGPARTPAGVLLADALRAGADAAMAAVARPAPGTMLTAAAGAAAAAAQAADETAHDVVRVAEAALAGAREAVLGSPGQLDVLARHGVLDAGAYGLTLVLGALHAAVAPSSAGEAHAAGLPTALVVAGGRVPVPAQASAHAHGASDDPDGEFEVMYVVEAAPDSSTDVARGLRAGLERIGESVVVVGGNGLWQAHVHTDDPAAALAAAGGATLRQVRVRHLVARPVDTGGSSRVGIVAGVRSPALLAETARSGAVVLARTDRSWAPDELRRVLEDAASERVVAILRQDSTATLRRTLHRLPGLTVDTIVVPDDLHVVAALAAREEALGEGVDDDAALAAMRGAVEALTWGQADADAAAALVADLVARAPEREVGLAMLLVGAHVPPATVDATSDRLASGLGVEVVTLASGHADSLVRAGAL
ncbi:hypothetical protein ATL41_2563 [Flavimobilis soli]|uniref:DhaL domain-containing protein n=1 Tax=Flavimobilis soli TaxID=442709 RepID=A0A2A9EFF5_9MICO|nr:DAK2 domain-containing protein [Flavimobilis soli]PFG37787.1 hypothetical protein ATL41_2563 [Flavimobilis soli]